MEKRVLVTYATYAGSTVEVAAAIGEVLAETGIPVDVLPVTDITAMDDYRMVVVGSPIHSGEWLPAAMDFVKAHNIALRAMPVAYFTLALRLRDNKEETRQSIMTILNPIRVLAQSVSVGLFAGKMDYSKLSPIMRLVIQTKGLPEGDFRDWDAIRSWANRLKVILLSD